MRQASLGVLFSALVGPVQPEAIPIRVSLVLVDGAAVKPTAVEVVGRASGTETERLLAQVEMTSRTASEATLQLPTGVWTLRVSAAGFWSPQTRLEVSKDGPREARVRVWPTAPTSLHFSISEPPDRKPEALVLQFRGSPSVAENSRVPSGTVSCPIQRSRATCQVPTGLLDLRGVVSGYIPQYWWDVAIRQGKEHALGTFPLDRGGSVVGYVREESGGIPLGARVELQTSQGKRIPASSPKRPDLRPGREEDAVYPLFSRVNQRGFFQIRKVHPGDYRVVSAGRINSMGVAGIRVEENHESSLRDFVVLQQPYALDVTVEPPTHPDGTLWSIRLVRFSPFHASTEYAVPDAGHLTIDPVSIGRFGVELWGGSEKWLSRVVEVEGPPGPVTIKVPLVRIKGMAKLGHQPLKSVLTFGGRSRPQEIRIESGDDGTFKGILPKDGAWRVQVESPALRVSRTLDKVMVKTTEPSEEAFVEIHLEDTRLVGQVVDEKGHGLEAMVTLTPMSSHDLFNQVPTDSEGHFVVRGLPRGPLVVSAESTMGEQSDATNVMLAETTETLLVVRPTLQIRGRVLSSVSGQPVPGATILASAAERPVTIVPRATTDPEGRFAMRLPAQVEAVEFVYWADGLVLDMSREAVGKDRELVLAVDSSGGTLALELADEDAESAAEKPVPVVYHRGASMPLPFLRRLTALREGQSPMPDDASRVVLPKMGAGDYLVCLVDRAVLRLKSTPADHRKRCVSGSLGAGGELALTLPTGSQP